MEEKRKKAIFIMSSTLSGAEKRFIRIASELHKINKDIILIVNKELKEVALQDREIYNRMNELEKENSIFVLNNSNYKNKYIRILSNFLGLYKIITSNNVQIIHVALSAIKYALISKINRIKVIAEITSPDVARDIATKKYSAMVSSFNEIIAVSEGVKEKTIESLVKINNDHLIQSVHCSLIPFFLPEEGLREVSTDDKENLIVYASRFIDRKNPILFAKAVSRFLDENNNWKVAILGKGPLEDEIKQILKGFIDKERVIVEHTKDVYGYLRRSKIFVSLIYPDNYPSQSILEAMFMKNAILATNVGNTNKLVTEKNGFLVNDYEVNSVSEMLKYAVSNEEKLTQMGEESSKLIEEKFSKDIYLDELQAIYNSLK